MTDNVTDLKAALWRGPRNTQVIHVLMTFSTRVHAGTHMTIGALLMYLRCTQVHGQHSASPCMPHLLNKLTNLQAFGTFDIANITCPVLAVMGTEDVLLGGQEENFCAQLTSEIQPLSLLLTFNASSGGALHDQIGSPIVYDSRSFSFLNNILGGPLNVSSS